MPTYDKCRTDEESWVSFRLSCGIRVSSSRQGLQLYGDTPERRYYITRSEANWLPLNIFTLKSGEYVKTLYWEEIEEITKAEFDTFTEFDLFPILEHVDESSRQ